MIEVTELRNRILATLEEAGGERANPLLNTVIDPKGEPDEVGVFSVALEELLIGNLIEVELVSAQSQQRLKKEQARQEIANLREFYEFDALEKLWLDSRFGGPPYYQKPEPEIVLTSAGRVASEALLNLHGFEWWRRG